MLYFSINSARIVTNLSTSETKYNIMVSKPGEYTIKHEFALDFEITKMLLNYLTNYNIDKNYSPSDHQLKEGPIRFHPNRIEFITRLSSDESVSYTLYDLDAINLFVMEFINNLNSLLKEYEI